jgi:predicted small lipoprotein YifL
MLSMLALAVAMSGCGLKGPLYVPGSKPAAKQPNKPAAQAPSTNQDKNP